MELPAALYRQQAKIFRTKKMEEMTVSSILDYKTFLSITSYRWQPLRKPFKLEYLKPLYIAGKNYPPPPPISNTITSNLGALRFHVLTTRNTDFAGRTCTLVDGYQFRGEDYFQSF
jgi:hypothetical protein